MHRSVAAPVLAFVLALGAAPIAHAAAFEVTGWLPYWRSASSTADVLPNLDALTEINPFVYTLKQNGTLADNGKLDEEPWKSLIAEAQKKGVRVIPTVMASDPDLIHRILSDQTSRIALEDEIAALVREKGYDGIDIDFEGKYAKTRDYFSTFLKGLYMRMGNKWVMCTIETRLPLEDQYYGVTVPVGAGEYSNDLAEINRYCDRVRVMAYDQQGIDRKLAAEHDARGELYAPVGDPAWVEKVITLMSQVIPKHKLLIGVPTYGYEYAVTAYANNSYVYDILWTFNPGWAWPIAKDFGITPTRSSAGELFFTYVPGTASATAGFRLENNPGTALLASAAASQIASAANTNSSFRMMVWPDAESVRGKVELAKRLGVRGVSVFKFDGGEDQEIWKVLRDAALPVAAGSPDSVSIGAFTRGLDIGSTGEAVRALQALLNRDSDTRVAIAGVGSPGRETAYFGPATAAAVKVFQEKYGIARAGDPGYGYVGPKTRVKLNEIR